MNWITIKIGIFTNLVKTGIRIILQDKLMLFLDLIIATAIQFYILTRIYQSLDLQIINNTYGAKGFTWYLWISLFIVRTNNAYDFIVKLSRDAMSGSYDAFRARGFSYGLVRFIEYFGSSLVYFIPLFISVGFFAFRQLPFFIITIIASQILSFMYAQFFAYLSLLMAREEIGASLFIFLLSFLGGEFFPSAILPNGIRTIFEYNPFYIIVGGITTNLYSADFFGWVKNLIMIFLYIIICLVCQILVRPIVMRYYDTAGG